MRIFIALLFTLSLTHACALCATYVPRVFVSFEFMLDSAKIKWRFDKNFHTTLLHSYDKNGNGALDSAELLQVKEALLAYISPRAHLTRATINNALETLDFSIKGDEIFMKDLELNYCYEIAFSQQRALENSQKFAFQVFDEGGFFNFIIESNAPFMLGESEFLPRVLDEGVVVFKRGAKSALDSAPKQNAESTQIAESSAESRAKIAESSPNQSTPNAKNTRFDFAQWGVALAAGIIPCPTMIIVLLLCFEVGFFSALASAISIALGMSAVVFITAILAHKIKLSATSQKISRTLEFLALFAMLILGIFMFANAESSVF